MLLLQLSRDTNNQEPDFEIKIVGNVFDQETIESVIDAIVNSSDNELAKFVTENFVDCEYEITRKIMNAGGRNIAVSPEGFMTFTIAKDEFFQNHLKKEIEAISNKYFWQAAFIPNGVDRRQILALNRLQEDYDKENIDRKHNLIKIF